jgi:hypothetical protein
MTQIFVARHPTEAHLIKGVLEAAGIPAEVQGERLFAVRGEVPVTPDTQPTVWVADEQAAAARAVIADSSQAGADAAGTGETWTCPQCGEQVEPQFAACWNCGASPS